jgi:hypothetical protein
LLEHAGLKADKADSGAGTLIQHRHECPQFAELQVSGQTLDQAVGRYQVLASSLRSQ